MGLFDAGAFAQPPGWLSALLQNPDLFNKGGIPPSSGFAPQPQQAQAPGMDAMAQAPALAAPQPPQQGGNFMAGINNLNSGGNPISMLANVFQGFATGQRHDPEGRAIAQQQAIYQALLPKLGPAGAAAAMTNPKVLESWASREFAPYSAHNVGDVAGSFRPQDGTYTPQFQAPKYEKLGAGDTLVGVGGGVPGGGGQPRTVATGGPQNPPPGYSWNDPKDPSKGVGAIPGGPATHIPSETAGRIAMIEASLPGLAKAKEVLLRDRGSLGDGVSSSVGYTLNAGEAGRAKLAVRVAIESALRTATGAAAPEQEVNRYLDMYMPMPSDGPERARQKFESLETFMRAARQGATSGRKATPAGGTDPLGLR